MNVKVYFLTYIDYDIGTTLSISISCKSNRLFDCEEQLICNAKSKDSFLSQITKDWQYFSILEIECSLAKLLKSGLASGKVINKKEFETKELFEQYCRERL